jgi:enoyl-CoA hydratase/carnithine racemase
VTGAEPLETTAIRVDLAGAIGRITLARPEKLNALNRAALEEIASAAVWFDRQSSVKVVVVAGAGPSFSAGFDLADPAWAELGSLERSAVVGRAMAESVAGMKAVTIGSIRGHCIGGGVVLASACDLRVASASARFKIPEVDLGVPLFWTGIPRLARELGPALTKELVLTGRPFTAEEARAIRFANRVVPDAELEAATDALATELAAKPALVLDVTKRQVEQAAPPVPASDPGGEDDARTFAAALADPEARAAAAEYVERLRRQP